MRCVCACVHVSLCVDADVCSCMCTCEYVCIYVGMDVCARECAFLYSPGCRHVQRMRKPTHVASGSKRRGRLPLTYTQVSDTALLRQTPSSCQGVPSESTLSLEWICAQYQGQHTAWGERAALQPGASPGNSCRALEASEGLPLALLTGATQFAQQPLSSKCAVLTYSSQMKTVIVSTAKRLWRF